MTPAGERAPGQGHPAPWLIPAVAVLAAFYAVPVLDVTRLAFSDATLIQPASGFSTAALRSIRTDPALPQVLGTTLVFVAVNVAVLQLAGLAIALLIVRGERRKLPGMAAFRTLVLAAWVVPGIANGLIWGMLFDEAPYGTLNSLLAYAGLGPVSWLSDPQMALVSVQTLNTFDSILALTGGGPGRATEVLSLFTFNTVFYNLDLAGGSVLAVLLFAIGMGLTIVIGWLGRDRV